MEASSKEYWAEKLGKMETSSKGGQGPRCVVVSINEWSISG
jgi:hypothetical protein